MARDNWYALPNDPNQWQSFVLSTLARKIPDIPKYIVGIEFNKMDPVLGDADGLIYLLNGMAAIPITVRQSRMAPLDIMVSNKEEFYPVNETFLQKLYADNVIGEPSNEPGYNEDSVEEGPAQHIRYYNTVNETAASSAKLASEATYATKQHLLKEIEKSAKLLTFFNDKMPELLEVLYTATPDSVKVASEEAEEDMPSVFFLQKKDDTFFFNGEAVSTKVASEFMTAMEMTDKEKLDMLNGGYAFFDHREKTASIVINENSSPVCEENYSNENNGRTFIAEVVDVQGNVLKGLLHRKYSYDNKGNRYLYIFTCDEGYAVQEDLVILSKVAVNLEHAVEASVPTKPEVGMFGTVMSNWEIEIPFNVCAVQSWGNITTVQSAAYDIESKEYELNDTTKFYTIVDNKIELARNNNDAFHSVEGQNVSVALNGDGKIILASEEKEYEDAIYTLIADYDLNHTDAFKVASKVLEEGKALFKLAATDKKDTGKSKAEKKQPTQQTQQAAPAVQQMQPVSQQDLDDIASVNDTSLMDAYITGRLTDINTAGREQLMQASDSIVNATKALGRVLFLIRLGKLDYVKEEDAQLALNKLSDVAKNLGVAASQLG